MLAFVAGDQAVAKSPANMVSGAPKACAADQSVVLYWLLKPTTVEAHWLIGAGLLVAVFTMMRSAPEPTVESRSTP